MSGVRPASCDVLECIARSEDPRAVVWRGSGLDSREQGIKILGIPVGHHDFITAFLERKATEHQTLLRRIPVVPDVQSAWLLLLHCAQARANFLLRGVQPSLSIQFATDHDNNMWRCMCEIPHLPPEQCDAGVRNTATLPMVLGGMGLRSATRMRNAAFWASWADCLPMIWQRHPAVAAELVREFEDAPATPCLQEVVESGRGLTGVMGFEPPLWRQLMAGERPPAREPDETDPGSQRSGWQHEAVSRVERAFRDTVLFPQLSEQARALVRSQGGPIAGSALAATPTCLLTRIESHLFRVVLLRRLRQPLPLSAHNCRCGRPLDVLGHHRAACARAGVLGQMGFAVESVVARICREGGGRVRTNIMVRDLDMELPHGEDARRLEVVVDGLPLFGGRQLAVDTTLVGVLHANGQPMRRTPDEDWVRLLAARRRKERTYPELVGRRGRATLVVLAGEIGGRWSEETRSFLSQLAKARARSEIPLMRKRMEQAWWLR